MAEVGGEAEEKEKSSTIEVGEPPVRPVEAYVLYVLYYKGGMPTGVLVRRVSGFFGVSWAWSRALLLRVKGVAAGLSSTG